MSVVVCTLFEGGYHHGAAAMINSLVNAGYRGHVFCGVRGALPPWAPDDSHSGNPQERSLDAGDLCITFLPVDTEAHLTNHKPVFMKRLLGHQASDAEILIYADPDICFSAPWNHLEQLLQSGILLCEDMNSPIHPGDPKREGWKRHFPGYIFRSPQGIYVNAGFVSLPVKHLALLDRWEELNTEMGRILGGMDVGVIEGARKLRSYGFANCLRQVDQDTLNAALDSLSGLPMAILGKQAMGFERGNTVFPHATGSPKPWQKNYLISALDGRVPGPADRAYWNNCTGPTIRSLPRWKEIYGSYSERIASFIGRFYSR